MNDDSGSNLRGFRRGEPAQYAPAQAHCGSIDRTRKPRRRFQGLLARIEFADGTHHYRVCEGSEHHHHLTCTQCHCVVDIDICLPADQFATIGNQADFVIEGHSLTLFGRCKNCRA
ncbi:MAG: hypothetical protein E6I93_06660 [Chloroflexi bacterium]|nr:MAG: hypothetical protein E6I93_06660 [Chloroflexota bacterium]